MIDLNKIYNEDCIAVLNRIPDKSIDLILTDPPYIISRESGFTRMSATADPILLGKFKNHTIDFGDWDKEDLDIQKLFSEFYRILKPNGSLIWFYDIWKIGEVKDVAEKLGFKQPRVCQWVKNNPVPINSKNNYLSNAIEFFITFVKKEKPTFNSQYDNGTYNFPIYHSKDRFHPTQKPIELMKALIRKHTTENMIILDPFAGSSTTAVAAIEMNRQWIMIEKNHEYYEKSIARIGSLSNQYSGNNNGE
jgi:site-specific DNA-methyltransferase (adenine-specific)